MKERVRSLEKTEEKLLAANQKLNKVTTAAAEDSERAKKEFHSNAKKAEERAVMANNVKSRVG